MSKSLGTLTIDLVAKTGAFVQGMSKAEREAQKTSKNIKKLNDDLSNSWNNVKSAAIAALGAYGIGSIVKTVIANTQQMEKEQAQLAAVLKSTGEAAGFSRDQLNSMAAAMEGNSTFSAGEINQAQTALLAFTGVMGDNFVKAQQAAADMASRTGMDIKSTAELIGRALDVPSKGMASLSRQGFRFTDDQKKVMEQLEATGRTAEAQGIILNALAESYGGAAKASRDTFGGAITAVQNTLSGLMTGKEGSLEAARLAVEDLNSALSSPETQSAFAFMVDSVISGVAAMANNFAPAVAFVADAMEGLRRTVLVAGSAIAIFGLSAKDVMLTVAKAVIDFPTQAVNGLITMLNKLPGVNIAGFGQGELSKKIEAEIQATRQAVQIGWDDVHNILMEPMPSESIQEFVAKNREAIKAVTTDIVEMKTTIGDVGDVGEKGFWDKWLEGAYKALTSFDQLSKTVVDNFTSGFGNAFESVIIDSESTEDAFKKMTEGMLRSIVNAIGQMIAQWIAYQTVQVLTGKTGQAIAAKNMAANAAAMSIQSGLNAYASTAAIPVVGPALAPEAMAIAIGVTAPMAQSIAALSLAGMAHDGIDSVPEDGTWLLQKGERVVTAETSAKLDAKLDKISGNNQNQTVVLQVSTGVSQTVRAEMAAMMPGIVKMIGQATGGRRR